MSFGDWLRSLRARSRLSLVELGVAAGVSARTVSLWELDRVEPRPSLLRAVLEAHAQEIWPHLPRQMGLEKLFREQLEPDGSSDEG